MAAENIPKCATSKCSDLKLRNLEESTLPLKEYHQAQRLGEGAFGAVCTVYDGEGKMFAMKVFECDEDDETLAKETLREVSILRLLRPFAETSGILQLVDVYQNPEEEICMVMPKLSCNLTAAIEGKLIKKKLKVAQSLLAAVAFLHENGIIHRDIKGDNIMFCNDKLESVILIDLSLAKPIGTFVPPEVTHTGDVGTSKYIAPEVYRNEHYSLQADMWSCGVVLLEVFSEQILKAERDKAAYSLIEKMKEQMAEKKPISKVLKSLLETDPEKRLSAKSALTSEPFKSKFEYPSLDRVVNLEPCPGEVNSDDGSESVPRKTKKKNRKEKKKKDKKKKGSGTEISPSIKSAFEELEFENIVTAVAADTYWKAITKHCIDSVSEYDCVLLASKLYENSTYDFDEIEEDEIIEDWDKGNYIDAELAIFKAMDYNLYISRA